MLEMTLDMLTSGNSESVREIMEMEAKVNVLFRAIRNYAIILTRKEITEGDKKRVDSLLRYTVSLENAGDVICNSMVNIPDAVKQEEGIFSPEGKKELDTLFRYLMGNAELAAEVIMTWHEETAEVLIQRGRTFKQMCMASSKQHFARLSQGVENTLKSSTAHLNLLSDMSWICNQVSSIGHDILSDGKIEKDTQEKAPESF